MSVLRGPGTLPATSPSRSRPLLTLRAPPPFQVTSRHSGSISRVSTECSGLRGLFDLARQESRTFCAEPSPAPGSSQGGRRVLWAGSGHPAGRGRVGCRSPLLPGPARPRADPAPAPSGPPFLGNEASWDGRGARTDSEFPVSISRAITCARARTRGDTARRPPLTQPRETAFLPEFQK